MKRTVAASAVAIGAILVTSGEAHKGITSKFTYNADVYPVFLDRCGRCHVEGGVGPMSLLKYEEAFPWAESLRAELLSAPSGTGAKPEDFVTAAHRQISARELDVILDWATGGTPEGDPAKAPPAPVLHREWARATPDLILPMPAPFELPADTMERTQDFVLAVPVTQPRTAGELDVLPGSPAIVRTVTVSLKTKDAPPRLLGTWFPRQTPVPVALKPPARLEPGAEVVARVHYKKTWKLEGKAMSDQTAIGFYYAD